MKFYKNLHLIKGNLFRLNLFCFSYFKFCLNLSLFCLISNYNMINKNDMLCNVNNCTILAEKPLNPIKLFFLY